MSSQAQVHFGVDHAHAAQDDPSRHSHRTAPRLGVVGLLIVVSATAGIGCRPAAMPTASPASPTAPSPASSKPSGSEAGPSNGTSPSDSATSTTNPAPTAVTAATGSTAVSERPATPPVLGQVRDFALTDQDGTPVTVSRYYSRVWVANFIFTECLATCPQQTAKLAELGQRLQAELDSGRMRFVSVTVDPERDSPDVLKRYASDRQIKTATWDFLTGSRDALWTLSKEGFKLPVQTNPDQTAMPILHSSQMVLIDQQGAIRGYYEALTSDGMARLERDLRIVLQELKAVPDEILNPPWMAARATQQRAAVAASSVMHQFSFRDERPRSGITFVNRVVPDAAKSYQATHYDHGNGVAPADVDGDGLTDLYFVSQLGGNQLWKNLGDGKFTDITETAGVGVPGRIGVTASFADLDNDGDPDLYVTTVRGGNLLFRNEGEGRFTDVTAEAGVGHSAHSSGTVCFDYDRDGLLDLFVCNVGVYTTNDLRPEGNYAAHADAFAGHLKPEERNERSVLYRNLGGLKFADVTETVGLIDESWTGDATPLDANRDGWIDLYVLNMQGHNEYYENVNGQQFRRRSRELFPKTPWGAMGVKVFDFDNDGQLDLYITDMHSDMSQQVGVEEEKAKSKMIWPESLLQTNGQSIWGNALFRSTGPDQYEEISDQVGAENYWPWGLSVGDVNADGFDDAFIASSMNFPFRYAVNSLLLNEQGRRWIDAEFAVGVEPRTDGRTAVPWFTVDCDGADRAHIDCQQRTGRVNVWSSIGSRSSVFIDLENDGDLDLVTNDFGSEPLVLVNDLQQAQPSTTWLKVALQGRRSNRDGLGCLVTVTTAQGRYLKVHDGKTGYLSQGLVPLYFGLATATEVQSIEVQWPGGKSQTIAGPIASNQTIRIEEAAE
jgi:enediyne biosynthesis protein E4